MQYDQNFKDLVSRLITLHNGDLNFVARLTDVPLRTLRKWRSTMLIAAERQDVHLEVPKEYFDTVAAVKEMIRLRQQLMSQVLFLSADFDPDPNSARALAVARLTDRVLRLDAYLRPFGPPVEFVDDEAEKEEIRFGEPGEEPDWEDEDEESEPDYS